MDYQSQTGIMGMLRSAIAPALSALARRFDTPNPLDVTPPLNAADPVKAVSPPLPACKPLNPSEAREAATLAQLRGALYPTEARN